LSDISISSDGRDAPPAFNEKITAAENGGASTFWIANHMFLRDPVALATLMLAKTRRIGAGLMAVSPLTLHPVQIAMAAATLAENFPGRVKLCLGVGAPADLKSIGLDGTKPLKVMREALQLIRALLSGETVRIHGEIFRIDNRRLITERTPISLVLAASGPQMLELAGAEADGVLISAGSSVPFVERTLESVHRGAKGRKVRTHALVYSAVDDTEKAANDRLRRTLAILLRGPHHKANLDAAGSVLDQAALNEAVLAEDWDRAQAMITDDIVRRHAASGSSAQVRERLTAYHAAGLDEIVIAGARDGDQITKILNSA
jgi:5,10-methylenetetrahydromethanopterin reductase